eukprot:46170-Karenia_brevis.AAC.1
MHLQRTQCNVLTLGLDQGSVGAAGVALHACTYGCSYIPDGINSTESSATLGLLFLMLGEEYS